MKYFITLLIILISSVIIQVYFLQSNGNKILEKNGIIPISKEEQEVLTEEVVTDIIKEMIKYGETKKGIPYILGKWDCSKFISEMLKTQGIINARLTTREFSTWNRVENPSRGDLPLFAHKVKIAHIGMLIETNEELKNWLMIHNSSSRGVVKDKFGNYWSIRYKYSVKIPEIGRLK